MVTFFEDILIILIHVELSMLFCCTHFRLLVSEGGEQIQQSAHRMLGYLDDITTENNAR